MCKTDTPEEATEYYKLAIGVFKSGNKETLVGHLPVEISCLLTYFLKAAPENKLDAIVAGNRKLDLLPRRSKLFLQRTKHLQIFYQRSYRRRKKASKF